MTHLDFSATKRVEKKSARAIIAVSKKEGLTCDAMFRSNALANLLSCTFPDTPTTFLSINAVHISAKNSRNISLKLGNNEGMVVVGMASQN